MQTLRGGQLEALILDPYRPYAMMLIRRLYANHGIRTVCLHSEWRERMLLEGRHPILRSAAISAHYMVDGLSWEAVAERLANAHNIVGVLPYEEGMVHPLATIAAALGLSWAQPDVLPAFRDKSALKRLVAQRDPTARLNVFGMVGNAEEALELASRHHLTRYVLKPNSGSGNQNVAFFDQDSDPATVRAYFDRTKDHVLLEEFIAGTEYWVNGQMDEAGHPTVVGVGRYYRAARNGVENLELGSISVSPTDPRFEPLRRYAEQIMRATGLRRSPFHLEAIIDDRGPCLVEVAARFCGELGTVLDNRHHGAPLDLISTAAHDYVSDHPRKPLPLSWDRVAGSWLGTATGDSAFDQRLIAVEGVAELEASPHFVFWIKKPEPGDFVQQTTSLTSRAWSVVLQGSPDQDPQRVIDAVRSQVTLHGTASGPWTRREKWPMYAGVVGKIWASRPRAYEAKALVRPLR